MNISDSTGDGLLTGAGQLPNCNIVVFALVTHNLIIPKD